jgi:hypothetical protein
VLPAANVFAVVASLGESWDLDRGYSWLAYSRKAPGPALGFGMLSRTLLHGREQLVLQCVVPWGSRRVESATEIVKTVLAFARNDLGADRVYACLTPGSHWAREVMERSSMKYAGVVQLSKKDAELFQVSFLDHSPYDLDQDVITGIGQILAVPS